MDEYASGYLAQWSGEYSIENDCTVFVEWINEDEMPAHVELTVDIESLSIFDDPSSCLTLLVMLVIIVVVVVAIGVSRRRRSRTTVYEGDQAYAVSSTPVPEIRPTPGPEVRGESVNRCRHCGVVNPLYAEFCQGCNKPTDMFRLGRG